MNPILKTILVAVNAVLLLGFIFYATIQKEKIRKEGQFVLIPLAPLDPRSLLQGDYMILNYDWSAFDNSEQNFKRGCLVFKTTNESVLEAIRLSESIDDLKQGERCLKYYRSDYQIKIGAESYFFQEGNGKTFEAAKFAGLRVGENGDKLLVALYDENKKEIVAATKNNP